MAEQASKPNGLYYHYFSEARFSQGLGSAGTLAVERLVKSGAETGRGTATCEIAEESVRNFEIAVYHINRLGVRPANTEESPEWIKSRSADMREWRDRATTLRDQVCAPS